MIAHNPSGNNAFAMARVLRDDAGITSNRRGRKFC
jgi:hypothetical protein